MSDSFTMANEDRQSGLTEPTDAAEAVDLASLVEEVVRGARQTEEDSETASNTASMVVMNVRMVSGMMGEMVSSISQVLNRVADSEQATGRAIAQSSKTAEQIEKLSIAVGNIEAILREIEHVAECTKILSLNAAIEAARAGEAGLGFAVVAREVKELAKKTTEATNHIGEHVCAIRSANGELLESVAEATKNFGAIQEAVAEVTASAREYDSSLKTVAEYAGQAADSVDEISTVLDRTASSAHRIAEKFSNLQTAANNETSNRKDTKQCR